MQIVTLDLIPQKEKPIVKLSQYDNNRQVRFMLKENGETYTLAGTEIIEVNIRKPDRNIVVITPSIGANAYVDVLFTKQAAACFGDSFGELSIKSGDTVIGTCNFIIEVEISPIYGGIDSTTEIDNLETQIEEIITEVLSDDYYTKAQTDTLLDAKANASDVYTKAQTDTLLNAKANASDVYTKEQTYTQSEVNALISGIFPTKTATGAIANFTTALVMKLVSCNVEEGATTVTRCGVNLWDEEWELGGISTVTGVDFPNNNQIRSVNYIKVSPNTTYYNKGYTLAIIGYDENKNFVEFLGNITVGTFTIPSGVSYIRFCRTATTYNNDISINYPATDTTYHHYTGNTVPVSEATTLVTESGVNNVFADSGEVTVQYKDTTL